MPRWSRDPAALRARYPDERWASACPREAAAVLLRHDHHVVRIGGRPALLLTYGWAAEPPERWPERLAFEVSFTYPRGHPAAPPAVQAIVDGLTFAPVAPPDRAG